MLIANIAAQYGLGRALGAYKRRLDVIETVSMPRNRPKQLPFLDARLKKLSGNPSRRSRMVSTRIARLIRFLANTEALDHLVAGLCNPKSDIRYWFTRQVRMYRNLM